MLERRIEQDLKAALLSGDRTKVDTLRIIKSALLYAKVEKGKRDSGLDEEEEIAVLSKEAKKRQESADLYIKGGNQSRAEAELAEKVIIEAYLPQQLSENELNSVVETVVDKLKAKDLSAMGQVIATVKAETAGAADGANIARLVKERLSS
jgi:hypothetical protein